MQRYFDAITRKAPVILAIILSVTLFFAFQLTRLRVDTSVMRMLVEDLPAKQQFDRYKEEFGGASDDVLVVFQAEDVFSRAAFQKIGKLTQALKSVEWVKNVVSLSTLKNDLDILNEWTLEDLRRNLNLADIFVNNVVSADQKTTALVVILEEGYQTGPPLKLLRLSLSNFEIPTNLYRSIKLAVLS